MFFFSLSIFFMIGGGGALMRELTDAARPPTASLLDFDVTNCSSDSQFSIWFFPGSTQPINQTAADDWWHRVRNKFPCPGLNCTGRQRGGLAWKIETGGKKVKKTMNADPERLREAAAKPHTNTGKCREIQKHTEHKEERNLIVLILLTWPSSALIYKAIKVLSFWGFGWRLKQHSLTLLEVNRSGNILKIQFFPHQAHCLLVFKENVVWELNWILEFSGTFLNSECGGPISSEPNER